MLEKKSMTQLVEKLIAIGGGRGTKLNTLEWNIRARLKWHRKAKTAVRHILNGERQIDVDEAKEIEAAHLKFCAERVKQNAAENRALFLQMRAALVAMQISDEEFYRPHIEAVGKLLLQRRDQAGENGVED
jgi:hypothetical protein